MTAARDSLEKVIAGALRSTIRDHGPITPAKIGSAAKRIAGNLKNARLASMASALGRKGGLAGKEAGRDYEALGKKGGRAGKGTKKPRSDEARRRMLARRLIRAADEGGTIQAAKMVPLAPGLPELHSVTTLRAAAHALGVARETQDLLDVEWE